MSGKVGEHTFSIEMGSRRSLRNVTLSESSQEAVLIEGALGGIEEITLHEDIMLEIKGSNGTLRIDIDREGLEGCLRKKDAKKDDRR
jgi:hypothetical protein